MSQEFFQIVQVEALQMSFEHINLYRNNDTFSLLLLLSRRSAGIFYCRRF